MYTYKVTSLFMLLFFAGAVLKSQLSADAWEALQSAFKPVVHPDVFLRLNQYAAFYSNPSGAVRDPGGTSAELDAIIEGWTHTGMPKKAQVTCEEASPTKQVACSHYR